ncbi:T9SS type A sorting domain-containing protein [Chitinophagaceae bacterium MMS25-I14]
MKKYSLLLAFAGSLLAFENNAYAQSTGSVETTGGTTGMSALNSSVGNTTASVSETLYIGPGNYEIDGTWEIYSKNVWISPDAVITGAGTIKFFNPAVAGGTASPTLIDGNNNTSLINVNIELQNASNMVLTDIAGPGVPWNDVPGNANLTIGANFNFAAANGDVLLGNYDMITATAATLSNYQPGQFVVTNGTGHLVHNNYTGAFTFPVGIAEGNYTPASVNNTSANTIHVLVQNYAASSANEANSNGIDRTWNIFGDNASVSAVIDLQHNLSSDDPHYNDALSFVTQYGSSIPNTTGQTATSTTAWQSNNQAAGTGTGTLTTASTIAGASERSLTYATLATTVTAAQAFFTKSSDPITPLPVQLVSFTGESDNCTASLKWNTGTELNTTSFEVQKSTDGKTYQAVADILAKGSNSSYSYAEATNSSAKLFYRLHMLYNDGKTEYSNTLQLAIHCNNMNFADVYPNPATDNITVAGLTPGSDLYISDAAGKTVKHLTIENTTQQIPVNDLGTGTYLLQVIRNNDLQKSVKLVKK